VATRDKPKPVDTRAAEPAGRRRRGCLVHVSICFGVSIALSVVLSVFLHAFVYSPAPAVDVPPSEVDRQVHPKGFSVIKPGRTRARIEPDAILILPEWGTSRYSTHMQVRRWTEPPQFDRLESGGGTPGMFQGREAWLSAENNGNYTNWRILTRRGTDWYTISLSIPSDTPPTGTTPPPSHLPYLNSFSAPD
jgi:hypothetical protein